MYNRPVAVVCGSSDAGPSTHARFYEPISSQLPAVMMRCRVLVVSRLVGCLIIEALLNRHLLAEKKHEEIDKLLMF